VIECFDAFFLAPSWILAVQPEFSTIFLLTVNLNRFFTMLGSVDVSNRINQWVIAMPLINGGIQMMGCHSWLVTNGNPAGITIKKIVL